MNDENRTELEMKADVVCPGGEKKTMMTKRLALSEAVGLLCCAAIMFAFFASIVPLDNTAVLGGDEWEYQSMAVNTACGHGLSVFGMVEPFERYAFDRNDGELYRTFLERMPSKRFYRPPLYAAMVGMLYRYVSESPYCIKLIQLMAIVLSGLLYVLIGRQVWGQLGFWSAFTLWPAYVASVFRFANHIVPEAFTALLIPLIILLGMHAEQSGRWAGHCAFGLLTGVGILFRPTLIFVPLAYYGILFLTRRMANPPLVVGAVSAALVLCLWSAYASYATGKPVFITTQAGVAVYTYNNPHTTSTGQWWHRDRDEDSHVRTEGQYALEVITYYLREPQRVAKAAYWKGMAWMLGNPLLVVMGVFGVIPYLLFKRLPPRGVLQFVGLHVVFLMALALAFRIGRMNVWIHRYHLFKIFVPLALLAWYRVYRDGVMPRMPVAVTAIIVNFALVVMVFGVTGGYGYMERLSRPAYGLFLLVLTVTLMKMVNRMHLFADKENDDSRIECAAVKLPT